jgi:hypothetical protein
MKIFVFVFRWTWICINIFTINKSIIKASSKWIRNQAQWITTPCFLSSEKALMPRFYWSEVNKTNRSMRWRFSKKNTSWRKTNKKISWLKKPSYHTSTIPSWSNWRLLSKTKKNSISFWSTALAENCSGSFPSKISWLNNSKNVFILRTKFYAAQVVLALEALHQRNVIYRE